MILHFRQTLFIEGFRGAYADERRCIEHPRLAHLQTRPTLDCESTTSFFVDNVKDVFRSLDGALDALRANPRPGDIVAVPPKVVGYEPDCDRADG